MRKNVLYGRLKVICFYCKYKWLSASKMLHVTCPNCMRKTENNKFIEEEDETLHENKER